KERLVYYAGADGVAQAVIDRGLDKLAGGDGSGQALIDRGLRPKVDLEGEAGAGIVAYKAKRHTRPIDLSKVGEYDPADFWIPIESQRSDSLVLEPGDFYLMASRERFCVPTAYAAEMEPFDQS